MSDLIAYLKSLSPIRQNSGYLTWGDLNSGEFNYIFELMSRSRRL